MSDHNSTKLPDPFNFFNLDRDKPMNYNSNQDNPDNTDSPINNTQEEIILNLFENSQTRKEDWGKFIESSPSALKRLKSQLGTNAKHAQNLHLSMEIKKAFGTFFYSDKDPESVKIRIKSTKNSIWRVSESNSEEKKKKSPNSFLVVKVIDEGENVFFFHQPIDKNSKNNNKNTNKNNHNSINPLEKGRKWKLASIVFIKSNFSL